MKIVTVVGARPQFIKAAALSRVLRKEHTEILVHTGQHYDENMSEIFFREMGIPAPDYNLGISGGSHGEMTSRMLVEVEKVLRTEAPDALLVYGDTNSTLAAALAAVKLLIPVIHVEAGNRLRTREGGMTLEESTGPSLKMGPLENPEEVNRILTDHLAQLLFCATEDAKQKLTREGLGDRAYVVGNIMYDSFLRFAGKPWKPHILDHRGQNVTVPKEYYYMTCHRQENAGSDAPLREIMHAMNGLDAPTIYAVHPRNRERALRLREEDGLKNIILTQPVGYSDSVQLISHAKKIVTDSGGMQCEAFYAGVQCIMILDYMDWPETMAGNRNQLAKPDREDILQKLAVEQVVDPAYQPFGDGHAAEKICDILREVRL